ncbi:hypothetical protein ELI02_32635 [Rhizobium leguminosarum]|uniref:Uncharacterized protein n=1 Tax=Rhizobium leguminosarum TaxID=384 RepID=A0A4Q8X6C5_RHILE|nr:hypothetical protein HA461_32820 [Rhizobium leguminosarum bv. trifolii]QJX09870.1 hypothetical protein RLCC275e_33305 [Rhizobium brockwellii]TAU83946.1 hypothetical protein ELI40_12160 [Rhizobium leguminosarum]QIO70273.1 hypothetical protein HA462_34910 [Rhizobium leguminosarum bv. trifolii]QIO77263.1 hypothetical protein HA459_35465 [Rhizobium leguminosarum bv. trifolii]
MPPRQRPASRPNRPDTRTYHKGVKVSNAQIAKLHITDDAFHPDWNHQNCPKSAELSRDVKVAMCPL